MELEKRRKKSDILYRPRARGHQTESRRCLLDPIRAKMAHRITAWWTKPKTHSHQTVPAQWSHRSLISPVRSLIPTSKFNFKRTDRENPFPSDGTLRVLDSGGSSSTNFASFSCPYRLPSFFFTIFSTLTVRCLIFFQRWNSDVKIDRGTLIRLCFLLSDILSSIWLA